MRPETFYSCLHTPSFEHNTWKQFPAVGSAICLLLASNTGRLNFANGYGLAAGVTRGSECNSDESYSFQYTNKMQRYTIFFITVKALHVSGGLSAHHQELKNGTYSIWYMSGLLLPLAVAAGKLDIYEILYVPFLSSWWWAERPPETCGALTVIKNIVERCILLVYWKEYTNDARSHERQSDESCQINRVVYASQHFMRTHRAVEVKLFAFLALVLYGGDLWGLESSRFFREKHPPAAMNRRLGVTSKLIWARLEDKPQQLYCIWTLRAQLVTILYYILFLIFIFTSFSSIVVQDSNSSEYHIFYLKIASNMESLTQLRLKTNIASSHTHFTYQKLPQLQDRINRLQGIKEKNIPSSTYHKIYKRKTTSVHTSITLNI